VPKDAQIGLFLYDITGRLLLEVESNRSNNTLAFTSNADLVNINENIFSFNLGNLSNGMYFLCVKINDAEKCKDSTVKIIKTRNK